MNKSLEIKNRPIEHYMLSIFSLIVQGEQKILLNSYGSVNSKTIDLINLINKIILPNFFDVTIEHDTQKIKLTDESKEYAISSLSATLKIK